MKFLNVNSVWQELDPKGYTEHVELANQAHIWWQHFDLWWAHGSQFMGDWLYNSMF